MNTATDAVDRSFNFRPLTEVRAIFEFAACYAYMPVLKCLAQKGDGHSVLALPPFMSDDKLTSPLRSFLQSLGYDAHGWEQGRNDGFDDEVFAELVETIESLANEQGNKVSLIGHSLGGIYARVLAHEIPHAVRQVILLGTPFNINAETSYQLPVRKMYERMNPKDRTSKLLKKNIKRGATVVPSTAIYSEGDGFVPWQFCVDEEDALTENIRVPGSHIGMPFNPAILYAIADRLAQPEDDWQPFDKDGLRGLIYGTPSN